MAGPQEKLGYTSEQLARVGNLSAALRQAKQDAKDVQREFDATLKAGKAVSGELFLRKKYADQQIATLQRQAKQATEIGAAVRTAKLTRGLLQAQSIQRVLSGNGSFTDVASVLGSNKVEKAVTATFQRIGLQNMGAVLARVGPVAGIVADLTKQYFQHKIDQQDARGRAERAFGETFDIAQDMGLSPVLSDALRRNTADNQTVNRGLASKLLAKFGAAGSVALRAAGQNWAANELEDAMEGQTSAEKEAAAREYASVASLIKNARNPQTFQKLVGKSTEEALKNSGKNPYETSRGELRETIDTILLQILQSEQGKKDLARIQAENDEADRIKQKQLDNTSQAELDRREFFKNNQEFGIRNFVAFRERQDFQTRWRDSVEKTDAHNDD